ncbi:D-erythronate dehydrogenase [Streptomyces turgidiscabies]|uniref:NAD-binding protein n=1 Tax=Streptomyces turgidiscabies (strain Car8) TaxID=698760 RepID=L7F2W2_STRT8|nr:MULTISPECIES: D-erythronate dehydrogenase [Streptomyces]ELP65612.1 NAD-binding protein [Streptomyces turgidiscabies Car8]MDX3498183.1 NAD-dependent epimerase/dehydratase family protein [Streptomyces turgidiscabies]GAQ75156.1 UDP-glucose 4-epimerase [Streptomyces turgidiscabies]
MRIVITGGFGFLGQQVAHTLLKRRTLCGAPIDQLVLADRIVPSGSPLTADPLVEVVQGELSEHLDEIFVQPVDTLIHLASAVSAECEADFDLGMSANLDTTRALLDAARARSATGGPTPRLVFSSSIAVYGSDPTLPLPPVVSESTLPTPESSYGTQKLICEQLIAEYTRRGFVEGRVARLMTVSVRAGKPNAAASGFLSGIVREPLAGLPATCPVSPDLRVALASPRRTVEGILRMTEAERGPGGLKGTLPVNLPALTVTVAEMLDTLRRVAGDTVADLVTVAPDPAVEAIVGSWPAGFDNTRATALGLRPDESFESVVRAYIEDHPEAIAAEAIGLDG